MLVAAAKGDAWRRRRLVDELSEALARAGGCRRDARFTVARARERRAQSASARPPPRRSLELFWRLAVISVFARARASSHRAR